MNTIEELFVKYFANSDFAYDLNSAIEKYNNATGNNVRYDNLNIDIIVQMKIANVKYNLDIQNKYGNVLDWTFIFMFCNYGIATSSLIQVIDYDTVIPNTFIDLLKDYSFNFECAGNLYTNAYDYINQSYNYQNMEVPNSPFKDIFKTVISMWQGQMIRSQFDIASYLNSSLNNQGANTSSNSFDNSFDNSSSNTQSSPVSEERVTSSYSSSDASGSERSLRIGKSARAINVNDEDDTNANESSKLIGVSLNDYKSKVMNLIDNGVKQIIFTGAPGTGKTYLAKEISKAYAAKENVHALSGKNYQLVQFHTSFDYTDFVEGLRPMESRDKVVEFRKVDGIFKEFCRRVEEQNIKEIYGKESRLGNDQFFEEMYLRFIKKIVKSSYQGDYCNLNEPKVNYELRMKLKDIVTDDSLRLIEKTTWGQIADGNIDKFMLDHIDSKIRIYNPEKLIEVLNFDPSTKVLCEVLFDRAEDGTYRWKYNALDKKYFFVIDEINRADLSKVLGELMYCFEKDKRGPNNLVQTQYRNLVTYDCDKKRELARFEDVFVDGFFIPENVVIVGTMNDIDRSVESMDFALRRRFIFEEFYVDFDNLMVAFTSPSFKFKTDLALSLSSSTCLLNKYLHIHGEQYGINSHYDISQGQFSDVNPKMVKEGASKVKEYVWGYRVRSLLREYLRGENESEVNNFIDDAMNMFYIDIKYKNEDEKQNITLSSRFFKRLLNDKLKKDEIEAFFTNLRDNMFIDETDLWKKLV